MVVCSTVNSGRRESKGYIQTVYRALALSDFDGHARLATTLSFLSFFADSTQLDLT